jgi:ribonucleoside-triphosphate reductase (formate)
MEININLDKDFEKQFKKLSKKYGEEMLKINGFSDKNLNLSGFINGFVDSSNTANSTIDANANIQSKDIVNLINEMNKPYLKLLGYNKLFYEASKKYGKNKAKKILEADWRGDILIHNPSDISFRPYCFNYDLKNLAEKGMYFIPNIKTEPAHHLTTFCDHLLEFISWVD